MHQETVPILAEDVFALLGDKQSVEILIASSAGLQSTSNGIGSQTKKQYYVRLKRLVDFGLIEKHQSIYKLTSFGSIVYENHLKTMDKIIPNYWQIKSIDVLKSRHDFPPEQKEKIMNEYIETTNMNEVLNATQLSSFTVVKKFDDLKLWIMLKRKFTLLRDTMILMFQPRFSRNLVRVLQFIYWTAIQNRLALRADLLL